MCGIFGAFSSDTMSKDDIHTLMRLGISQAQRGTDAFGFAHLGHRNRIQVFKTEGSVTDHYRNLQSVQGSTAVIGHTRWATHGSHCDMNNNHPHEFVLDGRTCQLVHNGVISNYQEIANRNLLAMRSECDSEVLARHLEVLDGHIIDRLAEAVSEISPYAPFAAAILTRTGTLLARRGNPLYWCRSGEVTYYASTHCAMKGKIWEIPDEHAYFIPHAESEVLKIRLKRRAQSMMRFAGSDLFAR